MRIHFGKLPGLVRTDLERALRLELSRYAGRIQRLVLRPGGTGLRLSVVLDDDEVLELEQQAQPVAESLPAFARRAGRSVSHALRDAGRWSVSA